MTLLQVGDTRRPTIAIKPYDGTTTPSLSIVMPDGSASPLSLTGPVVQGDGSGLWTAAAPYTLSLPGTWWERFTVVNPSTGIGAGTPSAVQIDVEGTPPPAGFPGAWATSAQYMAMIGGAPPANLAFKLYRATIALRPYVAGALYRTSDATVLLALAQACVLQANYASEMGWTSGAAGGGLAISGQIGSMRIDAAKRADGGSGALPGISPEAAEVLEAAGLLYAAAATDVGWWAVNA
jgi:hypothetical protein